MFLNLFAHPNRPPPAQVWHIEHAADDGHGACTEVGSHTPALTVVIAEIFDEKWLLEIEAIAAA